MKGISRLLRHRTSLLFFVLVVLFLGLSLPVGAKKITITFWKAAHGADVELYTPIIEKFQSQNPDIEIKFLSHPWEGWDERYGSAFAAGTPPDISYMPDEFYPKFAEAGLLAKLDEVFPDAMKKMAKDYPPNFWAKGAYGGHQYGVPYLFVAVALFYNKDIFKTAGIKEPPSDMQAAKGWTWGEFAEVAQKLTAREKDRWGYSWSAAYRDPNYLYPYFWQAGMDILDLNNNRAGFGGEGGVKAVQFLVDLVHKYRVVPADGMHPNFQQVFYEGRAAMAPVESFSVPIVRRQYPKLNVGAALNPQGPGIQFFEGRGTFGNLGFMVVSKSAISSSTKKEAVLKFLEFLCNKENAQTYVGGVSLFGARKDFVMEPDPLYSVFQKTIPFLVGYPLHPKLRQVHPIVISEVQSAILKQKSPKQAVDDAVRRVNELLK
ncbi:MAG: sugar ABC transporter substrate-binding protein [Firmicutes bacterium]|nr:sugar ABC transporter substrate-binding protein [Bacillota bacterium]